MDLFRRRTFFVDRKIQGWVMMTVTLVCTATILVLGLIPDTMYRKAIAVWYEVPGLRGAFENDFYPSLDVLFLLAIPGFILLNLFLSMMLSHRIAGPLFNIKRVVREYRSGDRGRRVRLREGDYCEDLAAEINALLDSLDRKPN